jgi:creatinine amidohydrolase
LDAQDHRIGAAISASIAPLHEENDMPRLVRRWDALAWTEFRDLPADSVAILPVAAIEQHGPHLPLAVDAALATAILDRALARLPDDMSVLVLPLQAVGHSPEHARFPGTLSLGAETILALWSELGACVARAGLRRLLIFNAHGGQPGLVELVCRRLRSAHRLFAVGTSWFDLARPDPAEAALPAAERRWGIHAGAVETAMMRHLDPDAVREDKVADFSPAWTSRAAAHAQLAPHGGVGFGWETQDLHPAGAVGDARLGDAALGGRIVDQAAAALATLIAETSRVDLERWMRDGPAAP